MHLFLLNNVFSEIENATSKGVNFFTCKFFLGVCKTVCLLKVHKCFLII